MAQAAPVRRYALILLAVAGLTHFVGLGHPREVVFDEATFGRYVAAYCCTGTRQFDVHPPHGKLLIAAGAKIGGFDGAFSFERIGQPYEHHPVVALRAVPALAGTLIPVLFMFLLIELRASTPIAWLGGMLVALDNALLAETRIVVFDGILVAATLGALTCFLAAQHRARRIWWLIAAGALAGLAVGTKTTGLSAPGLMLVALVFGLGVVTARPRERLWQAAILAAAGATVYVAGWVAHWVLLSQPGPGDAFHATTGRLVEDLVTAHRAMLRYNVDLTATHPDGSRPWTWPLMIVVPYFWQGAKASIYMVGNPVVWWGTALVFFAVLVQVAILHPMGARQGPAANAAPRAWFALAGYAIAFLPFLPVTRVLFLYHYLTPLLFSLAFVLLWLDRLGWARPGGLRQQRRSYVVVLGLAAAAFLVFSPLTYGVSVGGFDEQLAAFVRSWR